VKPILPPLRAAIDRTPPRLGVDTFLYTEWGRPFSEAGIGNKMREWCDQAGLPHCSAHGLKKAAATVVAELGATDRMMMALFDWTSERQANTYTRKANKKKLAADAAKLLGDMNWERVTSNPRSEAIG
jgi:integrase